MTRQFCWKCGTKLLVASGRTPSGAPGAFSDGHALGEHVLERISAMEHSLTTIGKRVDSLAEAVERLAANNFIDHTMIETLTDTLEEAGIDLANLEAEWRIRIDERLRESEEVDRLGERMERIVHFYQGARRKQFAMWMERAYERLAADRPEESLSSLESAFRHDPSNYELGMLLAELFFQAQEFASAADCLSQVLRLKPDCFEATLLMGLLQKRRGNVTEAQRLLELAVRLRDDSPSAHATLGSLFMDCGNRRKAADHLNRALQLKPSAPAHFMLGAIYYQAGRQRRAIDHLKQATRLDPEFSEAFYQLGLLCLEMKWRRKAQECFQHAQRLNPRDVRCHEVRFQKALQRPFQRQPVQELPDRKRGILEAGAGPDPLNGLVRDELRLPHHWNLKRSKSS